MRPTDRDTLATTRVDAPKGIFIPRGPGESQRSDRVESRLVLRASKRLEIVCLLMFISISIVWLGVNLFEGGLANEFQSPRQWAPPVAALAASLAVLAMARTHWYSPVTLVRTGLAYQVVVSYAIAAAMYFDAFRGMAPSDFEEDRVGMIYVAPWMIFFTVLVPVRPGEALVALVLSAASPPLVYLSDVWQGAAPVLPTARFLSVFVLPYAAAVGFSYVAARIVHSLGVEVRQAYELGSYRLESMIGRGGMGEVWRASHRALARPAAVKVIRREARGHPALADLAAARFEREAQVIAELQSPHTVHLYDFGMTDDGTLYYVMELLDGIDFGSLVKTFGPLPAERVVYLIRQACSSLAEAHRRGVVHRDITPANLFACRNGIEHDYVKVLDFGLVKHLSDEPIARALDLTQPGFVAGTPQYMAPEVALGNTAIDGRADLYAIGCVIYWLLTGRSVFLAQTPAAAIVAHLHDTPTPPSAVSELPIPDALDRLVLECLAKDPGRRPPTAEVLASRLASVPLVRRWGEAEAAQWWAIHRPHSAQTTLRPGGA